MCIANPKAVYLALLPTLILCFTPCLTNGEILFFEDFESLEAYNENDPASGRLCGQGGWVPRPPGAGSAVFPCKSKVSVGEGLGTLVSDGRILLDTNSIDLSVHPLPPLSASAVTTLSLDIYAYDASSPQTAASGATFQTYGGITGGTGAGWSLARPNAPPRWQFDARGLSGNGSALWELYDGFDRLVKLELILDAPNLAVFGRIDIGSGWIETPHWNMTEATLLSVYGVSVNHDYRGAPVTAGAEIDNILVTSVDTCVDIDMDGYGYPGSALCSAGSTEDDCDDVDASVHPGQAEVCDGEDTDCDGAPDPDEVDGDEDGFLACEECNDADSAINPNAFEVPGNFVDENCDGSLGSADPCLPWTSHGHYIRSVAHAVEELVDAGLITPEEGDALVSSAAQSQIGKKDFVPPECQ